MRIDFDKISTPYTYPISSRDIKKLLSNSDLALDTERIIRVHFACNRGTTQEARIVNRGSTFEIRINFCLKDGRTRLLSEKPSWRGLVKYFGGVIDAQNEEVVWTAEAARGYAAFLLLHEVAHILYSEQAQSFGLKRTRSSSSEESWCDSYAKAAATKAFKGAESEGKAFGEERKADITRRCT